MRPLFTGAVAFLIFILVLGWSDYGLGLKVALLVGVVAGMVGVFKTRPPQRSAPR
jgi:hypothetical protein